jgi:4-hydroxy-tetrahydrodipicolinate synthase
MKPASFSVYSGNDDQTVPIMALGGAGIISVFSNAYPKHLKKLTDSLLKNDLISARKYQNKYLIMMNALFAETSPMPLKYVMSKLGLCENILRLPLIPVSKETEKILIEAMQRMS